MGREGRAEERDTLTFKSFVTGLWNQQNRCLTNPFIGIFYMAHNLRFVMVMETPGCHHTAADCVTVGHHSTIIHHSSAFSSYESTTDA